MANTFVEFLDKRIVPYIERGLLVVFVGMALYMYFAAEEFPDAPSQFPQMSAAVVIFTGLLVLFWDRFPEKVKLLEADNPIESLESDLFQDEDDNDFAEQEVGNDQIGRAHV